MLIHEERAEYHWLIRMIFLIPVGLFIASVVFAGKNDYEASLVLLAEAALFTLIFYFIIPRKYQIFQDRLTIVLGRPFAINIPLTTIKEARRSSGFKAFVYAGVRFATSPRHVVEIARSRGMSYVISPRNDDYFLDVLNQTIKESKNA